MSKEAIFGEIRKILVSEFECAPEKVTPDARFREDLDLDSIDAVDLVVRLQKQTGIKVRTEDFLAIKTLGDVAGVIERLVSEQSGQA